MDLKKPSFVALSLIIVFKILIGEKTTLKETRMGTMWCKNTQYSWYAFQHILYYIYNAVQCAVQPTWFSVSLKTVIIIVILCYTAGRKPRCAILSVLSTFSDVLYLPIIPLWDPTYYIINSNIL